MCDNIINIKELNVGYFLKNRNISILRGIDFKVSEKEQLGIAGESGSGKTTVALSILKLLKPNTEIFKGEILYRDRNILDMNDEELLNIRGKEISMVFQHPFSSLNPVIKIGEQIRETIFQHKTGLDVRCLLELVNLKDYKKIANAYPHQLSGGMIQRVMLAIALAGKPSVLIADEPTTALDKTLEKEIVVLLKNLIEKENLTLVFISHNLGLINFLTNHLIVMYSGVVVEEGKTGDILKKPFHPYTKALIDSYPKPGKNIISIPGDVPDITSLPKGCKFYPRCRYARKECVEKEPELYEIDGRKVRCFLRKI